MEVDQTEQRRPFHKIKNLSPKCVLKKCSENFYKTHWKTTALKPSFNKVADL